MRIPWNKGLKLGPNPEHSKRMKGRKLTKEHKQKISQALKGIMPKNLSLINANKNGSNNPAWKGGITTEHYRLRRSNRFKNWRIKIFERDNYTCQMVNCMKRGVELEAHHIKQFSQHPKLRFEVTNGITLCKPCHKAITGRQEGYLEEYFKYRARVMGKIYKKLKGVL